MALLVQHFHLQLGQEPISGKTFSVNIISYANESLILYENINLHVFSSKKSKELHDLDDEMSLNTWFPLLYHNLFLLKWYMHAGKRVTSRPFEIFVMNSLALLYRYYLSFSLSNYKSLQRFLSCHMKINLLGAKHWHDGSLWKEKFKFLHFSDNLRIFWATLSKLILIILSLLPCKSIEITIYISLLMSFRGRYMHIDFKEIMEAAKAELINFVSQQAE